MSQRLDPSLVRHGRVNGRYFRENFAQGGIDLVQIVPELVTNADAAIAAGGRPSGRIVLRFGPPDPDFAAEWKRAMRRLRAPALLEWRHQLRCSDDGVGMDAAAVDRRLGALGVTPDAGGQRGLFGRGLRDVWLAQGGGRIEGVHDGRLVESWFFPSGGNDPYAYVHVRDEPASAAARAELGLDGSGTRITVPLAAGRPPANARLRRLVGQLVQLRPVLEDPARELWLELPGEPAQLVTLPAPEPDPERPLLFDDEIDVAPGVHARVIVRRAAEPIPLSPSRATRLGGLVIRSGRAAHETTLAGHEGEPGTRHLYGEVICEELEQLQRAALESPRPQVVVKVDRSGLNEHHPFVQRLSAAIERVLRPIVAAEERRAGAHLVRAGRAVQARDQVGLRALNDALRSAFDAPGTAGFERGGAPADAAARVEPEPGVENGASAEPSPAGSAPDVALVGALRFKQSPVRLHPGEDRSVSLVIDPARVPPGTPVTVTADAGLRLKLWEEVVPEPNRGGWARLTGTLRARVSVEPGARLSVIAEAAGHMAELEVLSCATAPAGGSATSPARTRMRSSRRTSSPRAASSPSTRAAPSSRRSSAPPAAPASSPLACASTSPTACSRSRPPPTPSITGRPRRSSPGASPASCATTPSSTPTPCATRRSRSATAPTRSSCARSSTPRCSVAASRSSRTSRPRRRRA